MTAEPDRPSRADSNRYHLWGAYSLLLASFLFFLVVLIRNAWLCDDIFITFRTIDNFLNGYGLRWNVADRVQTYTHPLWMMLLTFLAWITGEIYFSNYFVSIAVTSGALLVYAFGIARSPWSAAFGLLCLSLSNAFVDYSTSGLENPMTHLLLAIFLWRYFSQPPGAKPFFILALTACLAALNRLDTFLFFIPPLLHFFLLTKGKERWGVSLCAFLPLILWFAFSLYYYGFLFPNTAYAKLNTGLESGEMAKLGLTYFLDSVRTDPLTLPLTACGIVLAFLDRSRKSAVAALGILLYLLYIVRIGGDFMSGRFFSGPFFCAIALLTRIDSVRTGHWSLAAVPVLILGLTAPGCPVFDGGESARKFVMNPNSISDERSFFYFYTGLLHFWRIDDPIRRDEFATIGLQQREAGPSVVEGQSVGVVGFFAGPETHLIDRWALGDALLARLHPTETPGERIGHFSRTFPAGYVETIQEGTNRIEDEGLARYYDKLAILIRGDLFSWRRMVEIWKMNTGAYDGLLEDYENNAGLTGGSS